MSFGFSLSDIIKGYTLASDIYYHCFTKAQGADVKYLQFGTEIRLLGDSLKRLERIIANADVQHPRRPWHKETDRIGPNTLQEVTGDFIRTLTECQTLLDDNSKFHRSSANFIDNIVWWSATERDVIGLRERVHFHLTKVNFIAKPFETQLLLGIRRELQQLRRDVADLRTVLVQDVRGYCEPSNILPFTTIPEDLTLRFTDALYVNKPKLFESQNRLPLKEGFDALVFNFANSTIEFNARPGLGQNFPEEPQFLNLIKSRWILQQLEDSYHYRAAGSDSLWADYLRELKDEIREQFRRFDTGNLVAPPLDAIARLPDSCFAIWVVESSSPPPPDLAEQRPFEEKILELALPSSHETRQSSLTIFRKSDVDFRLVSTTTDEHNKDFHREESMDISMHSTRLVPAYGIPDGVANPTNNILLCSNQAQTQKWYSLVDAAGVARFQQALTGYRVFHDMHNVSWSIEGSAKPHNHGNGRLQLWHFKPLPKIPSELEVKDLGRNFSISTSGHSPPIGGPKVDKTMTGMSGATYPPARSATSPVSIGSIASPVNGPRGEGTALIRPEAPSLIMLTMCERRYTLWHIKLESSVYVKEKLCDCKYPKKGCKRVVLANKSRSSLAIRRLCVKQEYEMGLHDWDVACFRYPRHPEYDNLNISKKDYLCLDFATTLEKEDFCKELGLLEGLRNLDINDYDRKYQEKKYSAAKPGRR